MFYVARLLHNQWFSLGKKKEHKWKIRYEYGYLLRMRKLPKLNIWKDY